MSGIVLSGSVTTKQSQTLLRAGSGTLTIVDNKVLSTTNQLLTISADDTDIVGAAQINSGSTAVLLTTEDSKTIGIGTAAHELDFTGTLAHITAEGITIGSAGINKSVKVVG